ncbi:hypothetical protein [Actinomyces vulturis]|uniref:hypothetical protein n=1 Tax=Actinomyces vulturis TaxID=1857645 RepID=UPI0008375F36|nr:hypothetical protein [Actinomyces vulturis]
MNAFLYKHGNKMGTWVSPDQQSCLAFDKQRAEAQLRSAATVNRLSVDSSVTFRVDFGKNAKVWAFATMKPLV